MHISKFHIHFRGEKPSLVMARRITQIALSIYIYTPAYIYIHLQPLGPALLHPGLSPHLCFHDYLFSAHSSSPGFPAQGLCSPSQEGCSYAHAGPLPQLASSLTSTRTWPPMLGVSQGGEDRLPAEDGATKKMAPQSLLGPLYLTSKITDMLLITVGLLPECGCQVFTCPSSFRPNQTLSKRQCTD